MKKTITVNLNGRVFTIDEDAYRLLDNYLNNLRIYFRKEEGASEIIADFEARIEELLSEKTRLGYEVITIEQIEEVIARVGKPADFADSEDTDEEKQPCFTEPASVKKKFFRNVDDKMFGGVCSGVSAYFGWNVLPVRIVFIILLFATSLWIVPFYLIAWIVFPGANTAEQKLQMRGKPITVENIGKTVAAEAGPVAPAEHKGCLSGFIDLCVGLMKVVMIGLGCLIGLPLIIVIFALVIALIAALFGVGGGLLGFFPAFVIADHPVLATIAFLLVVGIPVVALIYAIISHFAKLKPVNKSVKWTFLIIWILALVSLLFSGFRFEQNNFFNNFRKSGNTNWSWNWSKMSDSTVVRGNGVLSERTFVLNGPVTNVEMGDDLYASLQIEQTADDSASIVINGDENLIDQVKYDLQDGRLVLSAYNPLRSENNLIVKLRTKNLKGVSSTVLGNIQMNGAFRGDEMEITVNGPTRFHADSLYVKSLRVHSEGIASIDLSGKVNTASFDLNGAGKINALDLVSDTVHAQLEGIGSIQCNPVDYIDGHLQGIGKITYKDEPKVRNLSSEGIGKIGKE